MGLLKQEALRLLRDDWKSLTALAEEFYAILTSDVPITLDGPVTITNPSSKPGLTIRQEGSSDISISVERSVLGPVANPAPAPLAATPGFAPVRQLGNVAAGDASQQEKPVASSSGGSGLLGKVTAGTGAAYTVSLYGNGPSNPATGSVSATVPQIDPLATVPANTWVVVLLVAGSYYFQPAVWL